MSIQIVLSQDHKRLDALLAQAARQIEDGDLARARASYDAFESGLRRHIRYEEERLFPLFRARTGIDGGPLAVMADEHREILRTLDEMRRALDTDDVPRFDQAHAELDLVLPDHNEKEEAVLYPEIDSLTTADERRELVEELERF